MRNLTTGLLLLALSFAACAADGPSVLVKTATIRQQPLLFGLSGYGVVSPAPGSAVNISFPHAGQVKRLKVVAGQAVRRGETLFVFATDATAANSYAQAQSALELAHSEYTRASRLFKQQLIDRVQLAAAKKAWLDAQSAVRAQQRMGSGSGSTRIRAPFGGIITALYAAEGDRIAPGKAVLQLARRNAWHVEIGLQPEDVPGIKRGMKVRLHAVLDPSLQVQGIVTQVNAMPDPQTQLVSVSVKIKEAGALVPGMQVRGFIQVQSASSWVVPSSAVLQDDHGSYIFQDDHGQARRVEVRARVDGPLTGISGKFDPKLPVVVLGNYELTDGMALREDNQ